MGLRRIITIIVTVIATTGIVYLAYEYVKDLSTPEPDPLAAVPSDAVFILETDDPDELWDRISNRSIIWENLKQSEYFAVTHEIGVLLDSAVSRTKSLNDLTKENKFVISLHRPGGGQNEFFVACLDNGMSVDDLKNALNDAAMSGVRWSEINVSGSQGWNMGSPIFGEWNFVVHEGLILASTSPTLLEYSIKRTGQPIDEGLDKIRADKQSLDKAVGRIYINYGGMFSMTSGILKPEERVLVQGVAGLAGWAGLDLYVGPDKISMHGMSSYDSESFYDVFAGQEPVDFRIGSILPENTATLLAIGISDRQRFIEEYRKVIFGTKAETHLEELEAQSSRYGTDFEHDLLSWLGQEIAVFTTEMKDSITTEHQYVAMAIDPTSENPEDILFDLSRTIASYFAEEIDTTTFRGVKISSISLPVDYSFMFGDLFSSIDNPHYAVIGEYVVFANSADALKRLVRDRSYKTLAEDVHYNRFLENNLSAKSNVLLYCNVANSAGYAEAKLNDRNRSMVAGHRDLIMQFEGFAWQMINTGDGTFYSNIALVHNPDEKEERLTLWEVKLGNILSGNPQTIYNHRTKTREVVAFDTSNTMYLISNTGKLKWKRSVDGQVIGDIKQVDIFNNGKLQMLFNTKDKLYMVDILGRDVQGFPIKLPSQASSEVAAFDYDNDHDYRFTIGLMDHRVHMYDKEGKLVNGYKFEGDAPINVKPVHHRIGNKDYIIMADMDNNVYVSDRRGDRRYEVKVNLKGRVGDAWFEPTSDISTCKFIYRDSSGTAYRARLDGGLKGLELHGLKSYSWFTYRDMAGDKGVDYIYSRLGGVECFGRNNKKLFEFELPSAEDMVYNFVSRGDESTFILFLDPTTGEVGVINRQGERHNDFPIIGYGGMTIDDLNGDGMFELITGASDGSLYAYPMR